MCVLVKITLNTLIGGNGGVFVRQEPSVLDDPLLEVLLNLLALLGLVGEVIARPCVVLADFANKLSKFVFPASSENGCSEVGTHDVDSILFILSLFNCDVDVDRIQRLSDDLAGVIQASFLDGLTNVRCTKDGVDLLPEFSIDVVVELDCRELVVNDLGFDDNLLGCLFGCSRFLRCTHCFLLLECLSFSNRIFHCSNISLKTV